MKAIVVYSSKGGVGKSTIACNLAFSLRAAGGTVGILDADFKTPSISKLVAGIPMVRRPQFNGRRITPAQTEGGVYIQSTAYFNENDMLFWPDDYIEGAVWQLFNPRDWEGLDYLVIDMPPAIDSVHAYLCSVFKEAKVVFVSTYSLLSIEDCKKGITFMSELEMDVIGLVMNMVYVACPDCGKQIHLFDKKTEELSLPIIQDIPLSQSIAASTNMGVPLVLQPTAVAEHPAFFRLAEKIRDQL